MNASTDAPVRKKKLLTMAKPKASRRKISQKEKEAKLVTKCLHRRLAWCNRTGQCYDHSVEQYSKFPRALAEKFGNPHKAPKSTWTDKIKSRYQSAKPPVILQSLPSGWIPGTVIIDAMFVIHKTPLRRNSTITDYAHQLFNRYALPYYKAGTTDIHFLFDMPDQWKFNPKLFEQSRRDTSGAMTKKAPHEHQVFTPSTPIPLSWREYILCRQCKRSIVEAIGLSFLKNSTNWLHNGQKLVLGGCFNGDCSSWIELPLIGHVK